MTSDSRRLPAGTLLAAAPPPALIVLLGFAALALPTLWNLSTTFWVGDAQGHGPVILGVSLWLLWRSRDRFAALPERAMPILGGLLLALAMVAYVIGRSQAVVQFEVGSLILAAAAICLLLRGWAALRLAAFPLFFLLFLIPLPGVVVQTVTVPLKTAVSYFAETLMHAAGYPVARSGVILAVGRYELQVADACAGLTSIFTLEALGLLYLNAVGHASTMRNLVLAALIVPISFIANVVRVVVLCLVTYHYGDAAGQGFIHGFAGIVLFVVATCLMVAVDGVVGRMLPQRAAT